MIVGGKIITVHQGRTDNWREDNNSIRGELIVGEKIITVHQGRTDSWREDNNCPSGRTDSWREDNNSIRGELIVGEKIITVHQGRTDSWREDNCPSGENNFTFLLLKSVRIRCLSAVVSSVLISHFTFHFPFSPIKFFATDFSGSVGARGFKLYIHLQQVGEYCVLEIHESGIYFADFSSPEPKPQGELL